MSFLFLRVDPVDGYSLDMSLEIRPIPGYPQRYVIACRRPAEGEKARPQVYKSGTFPDLGEWDQPVTAEFFNEILRRIAQARIPPDRPSSPRLMIDGPEQQHTILRFSNSSFDWWESAPEGWEALEEIVSDLLRVVFRREPEPPREPYFST